MARGHVNSNVWRRRSIGSDSQSTIRGIVVNTYSFFRYTLKIVVIKHGTSGSTDGDSSVDLTLYTHTYTPAQPQRRDRRFVVVPSPHSLACSSA